MQSSDNRKTKWIAGIAGGVVIALAASGVGYAAHYSDVGLPGVEVAGQSVTGMDHDEIAALVDRQADSATLTLSVDGTSTTASLDDLGVTVDPNATADRALELNKSTLNRFTSLFSGKKIDVVSTIDPNALDQFGSSLLPQGATGAKNAEVRVSDDGTSFVVSESQIGQAVDKKELQAAISDTLSDLAPHSSTMNLVESEPQVSTADAQVVAEKANKLVALDVRVSDTSTDYPVSAADKVSWISLPEFVTSSDVDPVGSPVGNDAQTVSPASVTTSSSEPQVDEAKVAEWVRATGESTNEPVKNGVKNVNSAGKEVATSVEGKPGLTVNNADDLAQQAVEALKSGESFAGQFTYDKVEPSYEQRVIADGAEKLSYPAAPDEKWIDVDLATNSMTAYEGATVVHGPVGIVPGKPGQETILGTNKIYLKYETQDMGCNSPELGWCAPGVPWIMYFNGSYAIHGAPWFDNFGWSGPGGSHGCVNAPVDTAKWLYNWTEIGTTVVTHY